jgi:hypothetical protein
VSDEEEQAAKVWGPFTVLRTKGALRARVSTAPTGGGASPTSGSLASYVTETQIQDNWCWAAVSISIADFYKTSGWTQCTLAKTVFPYDCCGADGAKVGPGGCNRPWNLDEPLTTVGHYDHRVDTTVTYGDVSTEIGLDHPLGCRIVWKSKSAHFVAIIGYSMDLSGIEWVDVGDPAFGLSQVPYSDLVSNYRSNGTWTNSYYTLPASAPIGGTVKSGNSGPMAP